MLKVWPRPKRSLNSGRFGRCVACFVGRELKDSFEREFFERSSQKPTRLLFLVCTRNLFVLYFGAKQPSKRRPKLQIKIRGPIWVPGLFFVDILIFFRQAFSKPSYFSAIFRYVSATPTTNLQVRNYGEVRKQPPGEPEGFEGRGWPKIPLKTWHFRL